MSGFYLGFPSTSKRVSSTDETCVESFSCWCSVGNEAVNLGGKHRGGFIGVIFSFPAENQQVFHQARREGTERQAGPLYADAQKLVEHALRQLPGRKCGPLYIRGPPKRSPKNGTPKWSPNRVC